MTTVLITHPAFLNHDTGEAHPERPDRMRSIDKALAVEAFKPLTRRTASLRDDDKTYIALAHRKEHLTEVSEVAEHVASGHKYIDADTVVFTGHVGSRPPSRRGRPRRRRCRDGGGRSKCLLPGPSTRTSRRK